MTVSMLLVFMLISRKMLLWWTRLVSEKADQLKQYLFNFWIVYSPAIDLSFVISVLHFYPNWTYIILCKKPGNIRSQLCCLVNRNPTWKKRVVSVCFKTYFTLSPDRRLKQHVKPPLPWKPAPEERVTWALSTRRSRTLGPKALLYGYGLLWRRLCLIFKRSRLWIRDGARNGRSLSALYVIQIKNKHWCPPFDWLRYISYIGGFRLVLVWIRHWDEGLIIGLIGLRHFWSVACKTRVHAFLNHGA